MSHGIPAPLVGREALEQLRRLAHYLATKTDRPHDLSAAQAALLRDNTIMGWLRAEFEEIASGQTLYWCSPYRVEGDLSEDVTAFMVGPEHFGQEGAMRFYRLHNGWLEETRQITDEATLRARRQCVELWQARSRMQPYAKRWVNEILDLLKEELRQQLALVAKHPQDVFWDMAAETIRKPGVTLEDLLLVYLLLDLNPSGALRTAADNLRLSAPTSA